MSENFHIEIGDMDKLLSSIGTAGSKVENIVNDVLHEEAGTMIMNNIMPLLPQSGRTWRGKKAAAKRVQPFKEEQENLSVTVKTKSAYHYLYFPNDGSNTIRHAGNQHFMYRGAQKAAPDIIELCSAKIIKEIGGQ